MTKNSDDIRELAATVVDFFALLTRGKVKTDELKADGVFDNKRVSLPEISEDLRGMRTYVAYLWLAMEAAEREAVGGGGIEQNVSAVAQLVVNFAGSLRYGGSLYARGVLEESGRAYSLFEFANDMLDLHGEVKRLGAERDCLRQRVADLSELVQLRDLPRKGMDELYALVEDSGRDNNSK
jgi:hypothetical protein